MAISTWLPAIDNNDDKVGGFLFFTGDGIYRVAPMLVVTLIIILSFMCSGDDVSFLCSLSYKQRMSCSLAFVRISKNLLPE